MPKTNPAEMTPTLQVIIAADGDGWVAQGIEIDYAAGGDSPTDAKERFQIGLEATARASLETNNNLSAFLRPANINTWMPLVVKGAASKGTFRSETDHVDMREVGLLTRTITYVFIGATAADGNP